MALLGCRTSQHVLESSPRGHATKRVHECLQLGGENLPFPSLVPGLIDAGGKAGRSDLLRVQGKRTCRAR